MDVPTPWAEPRPPRGWLGWPGLAISLVALALAAGGPWLAELLDPPPRSLNQLAAEVAVSIKERLAAKARGETLPEPVPGPREFRWSRVLPGISLALGFMGFTFGIFALIRREDTRLVGAALAIGASAVVFQWLILLAAAFVGILLLGLIASAFQGISAG